MKYSLQGDEYFFQRDEDDYPMRVGPELAICFSYDTDQAISTTLFKHGEANRVVQYYEEWMAKLLGSGLDDLADRHLVVAGKFTPESMNYLIERTGVVEQFLKMNGLQICDDPLTGKPMVSQISNEASPPEPSAKRPSF